MAVMEMTPVEESPDAGIAFLRRERAERLQAEAQERAARETI